MKQMKKLMILLLCMLMIQVPVIPVSAADTVKKGWDSTKTHYYKNGKTLIGLQKIGSSYYYFSAKGIVQKNKFKKLAVNGKSYVFYFGASGAAYKAKASEYYEAFKVYTINGKKYAFDSNSHRVKGIWANPSGTVYYFASNGVLDLTKTKQLRKLAKYKRTSKTLLTDIKKAYGNPKKTRTDNNSCNPFDGYDAKYYTDYVLIYANIEVQMTKNNRTGVYCMSGVYPREK